MPKWTQKLREINAIMNRTDRLYAHYAQMQNSNHWTLQILYILHYFNICTQKDIAELFGLPKQTVNTIVKQLVKDGLICISSNPLDKRSKIIHLTSKGKEFSKVTNAPLLHCEENVLQKMGDKNVSSLIQGLKQYSQYLEEEINNLENKEKSCQ